MSVPAAARCRQIKVSGMQCGSPALRGKNFCFYHQQDRPISVECYHEQEYPLGEIEFPLFEDAHSVQAVLREVVQMVLQKRIEKKTASLVLYALQIASSNLKRMEQEKPQPEQVVVDIEVEEETERPIAAAPETIAARNNGNNNDSKNDNQNEGLAPGTIQACYEPKARVVRVPALPMRIVQHPKPRRRLTIN